MSTSTTGSSDVSNTSTLTNDQIHERIPIDLMLKILGDLLKYDLLSKPIFDKDWKSAEDVLTWIYIILGVTGFLFNLLVIIRILASSSLRYFPYNVLLINVFVSNIMMSIFCVPFTLISLIRITWNYGESLCKLIPAIQGIGVCVNSTSITIAAMERYFEVIRSRRLNVGVYYSTFKRVLIETLIIWIFGIVVGTPHALYQVHIVEKFNFTISPEDGKMKYNEPTTYYICKQEWDKTSRSIYTLGVLSLETIIPTIALLVTSIVIKSQSTEANGGQAQPQVGNHAHANQVLNAANQGNNQQNNQNNQQAAHAIRDPSITKTLVVMTLSFVVFWYPFNMFNVVLDLNLYDFGYKNGQLVYLLVGSFHCLAMTSLPMNAIIYGWFTPSIKRELLFWKRQHQHHVDAQLEMIQMD